MASSGKANYVIATPRGWFFMRTCGVSFSPGGTEEFYPGYPLLSGTHAKIMRHEEALLNLMYVRGHGLEAEVVSLKEMESGTRRA